MLTALIHAKRGPEALAVTLSSLVSGVAEGVIADAVVIADAHDPELMRISEAIGAEFVVSQPGELLWICGARRARREWTLCLEAGDIPLEGWIGAVDRFAFLAAREGYPIGRLARRSSSLTEWFADFRARLSSQPRAGDVVHISRLSGRSKIARKVARIDAHVARQGLLTS
jgi:hypothetical protein